MKLSDYVALFLKQIGIHHVFVVSGGASIHLIQSIADTDGVEYICPQHEQAGAMAADAYARVTRGLGASVATSGPGATNLVTGVACAYYDSVPVIFLTGQVATFRSKRGTGTRQIGFQETETVSIFEPLTKYAVCLEDPAMVRYELEKAHYMALEGRPGPVLVDIPDDLQRAEIDPDRLIGFNPPVPEESTKISSELITKILNLLNESKRPVLVIGWGVRLADMDQEFLEFVDKLGIPVVPTWAVADMIPHNHSLAVGTFGTHGTRYANFTVQNADVVLSIGCRLDTKATGSPVKTFAREAKIVMVDVDQAEIDKFTKFELDITLGVRCNAAQFVRELSSILSEDSMYLREDWLDTIQQWKKKYPVCTPEYRKEVPVNPYVFVDELSDCSSENDIFILDTGCALAWMMQGFRPKSGQRIFHDWNNTAMGWALPASIAASLAKPESSVICITGDGSLLMNIQELATSVRHSLPIKYFLINNYGHSMIRQTQDQWLGSNYHASSNDGGLATPDFCAIAQSFGISTRVLVQNAEISETIQDVLSCSESVFCEVIVDAAHRVIPQVKFGRPNEDSEPLLPREEFLKNMIVKPMEVSLQPNPVSG